MSVCTYSVSHVPDPILKRDLAASFAGERAFTAQGLVQLAEFDERRLYLGDGYPSMYAYCVGELHLSEDVAYKRIQAARVARRFPAIFPALADARLHLAGVCLLAPHLTPENAKELLGAAAGKTKAQIEELLAERFPRPEILPIVEVIPASPCRRSEQPAPGQVGHDATEPVATATLPPRVTPLAPQRFAVHFSIGQVTRDKLRRVQELLGHQIPSGDVAEVFDRALDALIVLLEKKKCGATSRPRPVQRQSTNARHIPANVRRAVWARDGGRCTFVGQNGHRCEARSRLEFDHIREVARGGEATAGNIRLRCRPHNQYEAERAFGADFMRHKREQAVRAAAPS